MEACHIVPLSLLGEIVEDEDESIEVRDAAEQTMAYDLAAQPVPGQSQTTNPVSHFH